MQRKTRSILQELESLYVERDRRLILENRATSVINSAVRVLELIEAEYTPDQAENLTRKFLNAIRTKDSGKFERSVRRTHENL